MRPSPLPNALRVLHIGKYYPPYRGGMENFLGDLVVAQRRCGIIPAALVHHHIPGRGEVSAECEGTLPIFRAPCYGRLLYAPLSPQFPFWMARYIKQFNPDILHFHLPNTSAFWAMLLPQARRLPWVIHWQSDVVGSQIDRRLSLAYPLYRPIEYKMLALSDRIVATSPPYLESSLALRPWQSKCEVIPLGLAPDRFSAPNEKDLRWAETVWGKGRKRILSVGRMTYYKGHEFLLKSLRGMEGLQLVLVGKGERRRKMENLIQALRITNQVQLLGACSQQELSALMSSCDCLCLPSIERTEAFGLVLLEAMCLGKAVVATRIPGSGVAWVVNEGAAGFLVPPADSKALSAIFDTLLTQTKLLEEMASAGQRRFKALFHIDQVADRLLPLYQKVMTQHAKR